MIDPVEELLQININYSFEPFTYILPRLTYRLVRIASGPESVAVIGKVLLVGGGLKVPKRAGKFSFAAG